MKLFRWITSILVFIFILFSSIYYWYLIYVGWNFGSLYAIIGAFIAIHFALIAIVLWQYLEYNELSFIEWWIRIFKKNK